MVDRFPEAFARFERAIPPDQFESYRELRYAFTHWAGKRWRDTWAQNVALKREAEKRGFRVARVPMYFRIPQVYATRTWRRETVIVRGNIQVRYRDIRTGQFIKKPQNAKLQKRALFSFDYLHVSKHSSRGEDC